MTDLHDATDADLYILAVDELTDIIGIDNLAAPISVIWARPDIPRTPGHRRGRNEPPAPYTLRVTVHHEDIDAWVEALHNPTPLLARPHYEMSPVEFAEASGELPRSRVGVILSTVRPVQEQTA